MIIPDIICPHSTISFETRQENFVSDLGFFSAPKRIGEWRKGTGPSPTSLSQHILSFSQDRQGFPSFSRISIALRKSPDHLIIYTWSVLKGAGTANVELPFDGSFPKFKTRLQAFVLTSAMIRARAIN